jgi:NAD(P) transhydrogenase subunit beta
MRSDLIQLSYLAAAVLFILGLKGMSSPRTARRGIMWAGVGMLVAVLATFFSPHLSNYLLMFVAIAIGGSIAYVAARKVAMTDMPQMVAIYNGMGGGAAALIAANEFLHFGGSGLTMGASFAVLGAVGALIGAISFSGSMIAFAKLQGLIKKSFLFPGQNVINLVVLAGAVALGAFVILQHTGHLGGPVGPTLGLFFALALLYGVLMTLPIGGADMPVVISLYNALTGLAVGFEGYVLGNAALIVAGIVVGAAGTLLTQLMAKAMNRSIGNVLFAGFGAEGGQELTGAVEGSMKEMAPDDAAIAMAFGQKVIIVPGYGMAVAQAQHKVWELAKLLQEKGVQVKFAIHPVAGRMPGHMNVLLAEAGVPYDLIYDLDEINGEFPTADAALVIGANDVVNPAARDDPGSPIYGMPILDVDKAQTVLVVKRGRGAGFAGIENKLFYADNTRMVYGDAQDVVGKLIAGVKKV